MRKATFRAASLYQTNLTNANLYKADFSSIIPLGEDGVTYIRNAKFTGADLRDAKLIGADLVYASFENAQLRNAIFKQAELFGVDFTTDLTEVDLSGVDLSGALYNTEYKQLGIYQVRPTIIPPPIDATRAIIDNKASER